MAKPQQAKPEEKADEGQREPVPFKDALRKLLAAKPKPKRGKKPS